MKGGRQSGPLSTLALVLLLVLVGLPTAVYVVVASADDAEGPPEPSVVAREYVHLNDTLRGYLSLPSDASGSDPKPAVVVIPDSNGNSRYEQIRATMVAQEWGWIGFAADVFGVQYQESELIANETLCRKLMERFQGDSDLFSRRIHAAVELVRSMPEVDSAHVALTGYGFGGTGVLTYALTIGSSLNASSSPVQAVVSYHGNLSTLPGDTYPVGVHPKILVFSGAEDGTATEVVDLEGRLNAAHTTWEVTRYSNVKQAFTVFDDARNRYNAWADFRSWASTHHFLRDAFDVQPHPADPPDAVEVQPVDYKDEVDGTELRGYVSLPDEDAYRSPHPVAVILPGRDGVNEFEKQRATRLANLGYVAFAADIYGADLQENLTIDERIHLRAYYSDNEPLYLRRIHRAIQVATNEAYDVDKDSIGVLGYWFGGYGVLHLAFSGDTSAKVAVCFQGGLMTHRPVATHVIAPYVVFLGVGMDEENGDQTFLEGELNAGNASWEITRYSAVENRNSKWIHPIYSVAADARSWESLVTAFHKLMAPVPATAATENTSTSTSIAAGVAIGWLAQSVGVIALYLALSIA